MRFFLLFLVLTATFCLASLPLDPFGFSKLPNEAFDRSASSDSSELTTGRALIFSSRFTTHELIEKNGIRFLPGTLLEKDTLGKTKPLTWKTSEGKACFSLEYRDQRFLLKFDPLCQVCGRNAELRFKAGTLTSPAVTVTQPLQTPCAADVLIATRIGSHANPLLVKDSVYESSLKKYMAGLAKEELSSRYVELDQESARDTFGWTVPIPVTLTRVPPREKDDDFKRGFYEQINDAYAVVHQLNNVQNAVFGPWNARSKTKFLVLLGGLTQMPMPGIPYPLDEYPKYSNERFIPTDELYARGDNLYSETESRTILKEIRSKDESYKAADVRSQQVLNRLIEKYNRQVQNRAHPIRVAVGRIPLPWHETSSEMLSQKLAQYAKVRTKKSLETLMVVDRCGGSDCFIQDETRDTQLAQEVVCSVEYCKVDSPPYCEEHVGEAATACEPVTFYKRMAQADTLYFFTHGKPGMLIAEGLNQDRYTVLTAKKVMDNIDLSKKQPVVYSDGCYSAALDVRSPKEEPGTTGLSASLPLALLKKGALLYVGSTRSVPSYKDIYRSEAGRTLFSPLAKYIRLTTSSKSAINRRVGDALLEAKALAFSQAKPDHPYYKLSGMALVLYGDPTLRALGVSREPTAVLLDGKTVRVGPNFAYAGSGCARG